MTNSNDQIYVGGEWRKAHSSEWLDVVSPIDGELIGRCTVADTRDADAAVEAAATAFRAGNWPALEASSRADCLNRLAAEIRNRRNALAELAARETGALFGFCKGQVQMACLTLEYYAKLAGSHAFERRIQGQFSEVVLREEPVGVVLAIVPYNGPLFAAAMKIGPALAAGCTVVLKLPPATPLVAGLLAEAIDAADIPAGVINILAADREVSEHLVRHAKVNLVALTGSVAAGQQVGAICAEQIKPVVLELGGKSAAIVCEDVDIEAAVPALVNAGTVNSGQACAAQTRLLIPRSRADELVAALAAGFAGLIVGDPFDKATLVGPLISAQHLQRVKGVIDAAVAAGASIAAGGEIVSVDGKPGHYLQPTLLTGVSNDMAVARDEIFGPVVCVIEYGDIEDAIAIANDSDFGLAGSVWSSDTDAALAIARRLQTGSITINGFSMDIAAPFGGYKKSGLGRELGEYGLAEYVQAKAINLL